MPNASIILGAGIRIDVNIEDGIVVNHSRHSSKFAEDNSDMVGVLSIYISELIIISELMIISE